MKAVSLAVLAALLCSPALAQSNLGTSPLPGNKGGTNNKFMQFTGPATSIKTFTLPNVSDTIVLLTQSQTMTNKTLTAPILGGLVDYSGAYKFSVQTGPSQITSNQNNYNPSSVICATSSTLLINSDAARDITGLGGGVAGCKLHIVNNGSFTITLKEDNASSTAGNRFKSGGDITVAAQQGVTLLYDGVASRWRNTAPATGAGGGSVTSVQLTAGVGISLSGTNPITTSGNITVTRLFTNATVKASPSAPANTGATTAVMSGFGASCTLTPVLNGRMDITIRFTTFNNTGGNSGTFDLRYGTGTAPNNADAVTGTQADAALPISFPSANAAVPVTLRAIATGLSTGVAYWFDLSRFTSANTLTVNNVHCLGIEF